MNTRAKQWAVFAILVCGLLLAGLWLIHPTRAAGPWYVTPGGDDGDDCLSPATPCETINGAIGKATAGDTVFVGEGTYFGVGGEVVLIDRDLTLSGGWSADFAAQSGMSIVDGETARLGINVPNGIVVMVEHFIIQNGSSLVSGQGGGGILNSGTLTLNHTTIRNNIADSGGGIFNNGILTLNDSLVKDNQVMHWGGGIMNNYTGVLVLSNSTVQTNTACCHHEASGGGIFNQGDLTLNNSTVSGNTAIGEYAGYGGGIYSRNILQINSSTISENMGSGAGGGISVEESVIMQNTLIANNTALNNPDCDTRFMNAQTIITSFGYNLIADSTGCFLTNAPGELMNLDAYLGPFSGTPGYYPLVSNSPAINHGNPDGCTGSDGLLTTDQRGLTRFGRCDIGAYEEQTILLASHASIFPGDPVTYTIALHNGGPTSYESILITDTLPTEMTYLSNSLTATNGSFGYSLGVITWTGMLTPESSVYITFVVALDPTTSPGTTIANSIIVDGIGELTTRTFLIEVSFYHFYLPSIFRNGE